MANETNSTAEFPISPQSNQMHPSSSQPDNFQTIAIPVLVLTEEEKVVLRECERDSFHERALPASFGAALAAHMLVRGGHWSSHPRFGSLPKVAIFSMVGFFGGKISYLPACQQKILEKIPYSNLAAVVRKSKGLFQLGDAATSLEGADTGGYSVRSRDDYSALEGLDDRFRHSLHRDVDGSLRSGLEHHFLSSLLISDLRISHPSHPYIVTVKEAETPTEKGSLSYEELRRRNRQQYGDLSSKLPARSPDQLPELKTDGLDNSSESLSPSVPPPRKRRTNMWGDPID